MWQITLRGVLLPFCLMAAVAWRSSKLWPQHQAPGCIARLGATHIPRRQVSSPVPLALSLVQRPHRQPTNAGIAAASCCSGGREGAGRCGQGAAGWLDVWGSVVHRQQRLLLESMLGGLLAPAAAAAAPAAAPDLLFLLCLLRVDSTPQLLLLLLRRRRRRRRALGGARAQASWHVLALW